MTRSYQTRKTPTSSNRRHSIRSYRKVSRSRPSTKRRLTSLTTFSKNGYPTRFVCESLRSDSDSASLSVNLSPPSNSNRSMKNRALPTLDDGSFDGARRYFRLNRWCQRFLGFR